MALTIIVIEDALYLQIFIKALSVIAAVVIVGHVDGLTMEKRRSEFFNEVIIMLVLYNMICFSPFVPDNSARIVMGYCCCAVVGLHLLVNLSVIFVSSVKSSIVSFKLWYARRQLFKQRRSNRQLIAVAMTKRLAKRELRDKKNMSVEEDDVRDTPEPIKPG